MTHLFDASSLGARVPLSTTRAITPLPVRGEGRRIRVVLATSVLAAAVLFLGQAHAAGDAAAGKTVFANQCSSCHTVVVGKNGFGPSLAEVIGRQAGSLAGYTYSPAMAQSGLVWEDKTLDEFLTSSTTKVPGTSMPVSLPNPTDRANVIAYLDTLGHAPVVAASAPTSAMTCCARLLLSTHAA